MGVNVHQGANHFGGGSLFNIYAHMSHVFHQGPFKPHAPWHASPRPRGRCLACGLALPPKASCLDPNPSDPPLKVSLLVGEVETSTKQRAKKLRNRMAGRHQDNSGRYPILKWTTAVWALLLKLAPRASTTKGKAAARLNRSSVQLLCGQVTVGAVDRGNQLRASKMGPDAVSSGAGMILKEKSKTKGRCPPNFGKMEPTKQDATWKEGSCEHIGSILICFWASLATGALPP